MATSDPYRADHLPLVGADILKLPTLQLQKIALTRIAQLTSGEMRGQQLTQLDSWPKELGECWKLYFDEYGPDSGSKRPPRYRVVYRFLPPAADGRPDRRPRLQVLAVAKRAHSEAYEWAADRLALPNVAQESAIQPPTDQTRPVPPSRQYRNQQEQQQGSQQQQRPPGRQW
jgi:hypothetical protein